MLKNKSTSAVFIKLTTKAMVLLVSLVFSCSTFGQTSESYMDSVLLDNIVVTAQYMPTDSRATVNQVRVIDEKVVENRAATSLTELLQTEANIRITQDAILGSSISINGLSSENVTILIDGVPVIGRLDGNIDAGQLPLGAVRRVEIIEGAQSLIYGSSASAGVINLLTRSSQLYKFEGEVKGLYETNGSNSVNARLGLNLGDFNVTLSGSALSFDPKSDSTGRSQLWNPKEQFQGRVSIRYSPSENLILRGTGSVFSENVTNLGEVRRPQFKPYALDDFYYTDRKDFSLNGEGWIGSQYYWKGTAAYNYFDRIKNSYRSNLEDATDELINGMQDTTSATGLLLRGTLASDRKNRTWDFMAGGDLNRETIDGKRIIDTTSNILNHAVTNDVGIFGSIKFRVTDKLTLQGGTRFTYNTRFGTALTPSLWIAWRPSDSWEVKASYANGFRSPSLKELYFSFIDVNHYILGNPDLTPEYSNNFQIEVNRKFQFKSTWDLDLALTGFYNSVKDRIILVEYAELEYTYQNIADWQTAGGGLTATFGKSGLGSIRSSIVLTGYYNTLSEESDVSNLSMSPDWTNEINIDLFKSRAGVSIWHKWTGNTPYYFLEDGETKEGTIDGWNLLNASVNTSLWNKRIKLVAGVKNILDVKETRTGGNTGGSHTGGDGSRAISWGRSFFIQASFLFHTKS